MGMEDTIAQDESIVLNIFEAKNKGYFEIFEAIRSRKNVTVKSIFF